MFPCFEHFWTAERLHAVPRCIREFEGRIPSQRSEQIGGNQANFAAEEVHRIESDVLAWRCPSPFDIWHDRAAFHFLTEEADRTSYASLASNSVKSGGILIVATFALDGPRS